MPIKSGEAYTKLFIGGLASTTDEDSLKEFYEQWGGKITDVVVMRDNVTKRSRGFGFVTFATEDELDAAMSHRPHMINGKEVDAKRAVPKDFQNKAEAQVSSKRVYVNGLKPEHDEEALKSYFQQYGSVVDVEIVMDKKTGQRRGFAFVTFDDYDPADKAVLVKYHTIDGKRVDCRKALSKDEIAKVQQMDMDRQIRGQRSRGPAQGYGGYPPDGGAYYGNGYNRTPGPRAPWGAPRPPAPGAGFPPGQAGYGGYPPAGGRQWGPQPTEDYSTGGWQPQQQGAFNTGARQQWPGAGAAYDYGAQQQAAGYGASYTADPMAGGYGASVGYGTPGAAYGAAAAAAQYGARPAAAPALQPGYDASGWSQNRSY